MNFVAKRITYIVTFVVVLLWFEQPVILNRFSFVAFMVCALCHTPVVVSFCTGDYNQI